MATRIIRGKYVMERVEIYFHKDDPLLRALKEYKEQTGVAFSMVCKRALDRYFAEVKRELMAEEKGEKKKT